MKLLSSIMSEKQWTLFYLDLDPSEGANDQNSEPTWIPGGTP